MDAHCWSTSKVAVVDDADVHGRHVQLLFRQHLVVTINTQLLFRQHLVVTIYTVTYVFPHWHAASIIILTEKSTTPAFMIHLNWKAVLRSTIFRCIPPVKKILAALIITWVTSANQNANKRCPVPKAGTMSTMLVPAPEKKTGGFLRGNVAKLVYMSKGLFWSSVQGVVEGCSCHFRADFWTGICSCCA